MAGREQYRLVDWFTHLHGKKLGWAAAAGLIGGGIGGAIVKAVGGLVLSTPLGAIATGLTHSVLGMGLAAVLGGPFAWAVIGAVSLAAFPKGYRFANRVQENHADSERGLREAEQREAGGIRDSGREVWEETSIQRGTAKFVHWLTHAKTAGPILGAAVATAAWAVAWAPALPIFAAVAAFPVAYTYVNHVKNTWRHREWQRDADRERWAAEASDDASLAQRELRGPEAEERSVPAAAVATPAREPVAIAADPRQRESDAIPATAQAAPVPATPATPQAAPAATGTDRMLQATATLREQAEARRRAPSRGRARAGNHAASAHRSEARVETRPPVTLS